MVCYMGTKAKRVVMAKKVAARWLSRVAKSEYRFSVFQGSSEIRNLGGLLRSLRDGKIAMGDVPNIQDLGVSENFDSIDIWSSDREGMVKLQGWFEKRGYETTGVW